MGRIILHIGPEKCGSTSVQNAVVQPGGGLEGLVNGVVLDPYAVVALQDASPRSDIADHFHRLIDAAQAAQPGKTLVLSHEMVFKSLPILTALTAIAQDHADEVAVIAYARRQSDFLVSAFGQWHFRSPERLGEAAEILRANGIDPALFLGVERHLLACILGGWEIGRQPSGHLYLDWSQSVPERAAALAELGAHFSVGLLPRSGFGTSLVADFLERAGIVPTGDPLSDDLRNPAFHPALIEAVVSAIDAGHPMPGPHEANNFFADDSGLDLGPMPGGAFLGRLRAHVDARFADANAAFASLNGLSKAYFEPDIPVSPETLEDEIAACVAQRGAASDMLERDRVGRAAMARVAWNLFCKCS